MAVPKPMLTEFGIHFRLESCAPFFAKTHNERISACVMNTAQNFLSCILTIFQGTIVENLEVLIQESDRRRQASFLGCVDDLKLVTRSDKPYLHFIAQENSFTTLAVTHWNEESCQDIEVFTNYGDKLKCVL